VVIQHKEILMAKQSLSCRVPGCTREAGHRGVHVGRDGHKLDRDPADDPIDEPSPAAQAAQRAADRLVATVTEFATWMGCKRSVIAEGILFTGPDGQLCVLTEGGHLRRADLRIGEAISL